jgi:hypothetical protein
MKLALYTKFGILRSDKNASVVEWSITTGCKPVGFGLRRFESFPAHKHRGPAMRQVFWFVRGRSDVLQWQNHESEVASEVVDERPRLMPVALPTLSYPLTFSHYKKPRKGLFVIRSRVMRHNLSMDTMDELITNAGAILAVIMALFVASVALAAV